MYVYTSPVCCSDIYSHGYSVRLQGGGVHLHPLLMSVHSIL
jgi:hypothetical protein